LTPNWPIANGGSAPPPLRYTGVSHLHHLLAFFGVGVVESRVDLRSLVLEVVINGQHADLAEAAVVKTISLSIYNIYIYIYIVDGQHADLAEAAAVETTSLSLTLSLSLYIHIYIYTYLYILYLYLYLYMQ